MQQAQEDSIQESSLRLAAITYYLVMLAGLAIGLYGLLSLFWLTLDQVHQRPFTGALLGL